MSERGKIRRAQRDAREKKQANKIILWIIIAMLVLALLLGISYASML